MKVITFKTVCLCVFAVNSWILSDAAANSNTTGVTTSKTPSENRTKTSGNQTPKSSTKQNANQPKPPANQPKPATNQPKPIPNQPKPEAKTQVESPREGIHISLGADPFLDRVIMWTYDKKEDVIEMKATDASKTEFSRKETVDGILMNNTYAKHWIMRYEVQGLKEDTQFDYIIGGKKYSFHTWDHFNTHWPEEFLLYGGHINKTSQNITESDWVHENRLKHEIKLNRYYGFISLGDWSCSLNPKDYLNYIQYFATHVPFLTTPGKKDMKNRFSHYEQIFSQHNVPYPSSQLWYSFDTDYAHFISITTEMYFMDGKDMIFAEHLAAAQHKWLKQDLSKINKAYETDGQRPWVIVYTHRPVYCSGDIKCVNDSHILQMITELFHDYSVDLVIASQNNIYERTYPVYNKKKIGDDYINPKATVYITTGAFSCGKPTNGTIGSPKWSNVLRKVSALTYGRLMIYNKTHLHYEERIANNHTTIDTFWMQQHHKNPFPPTPKINSWIVVLVVGILIVVVSVIVLFLKRKAIAAYLTLRKSRKSQTYVNLPEGSFDL